MAVASRRAWIRSARGSVFPRTVVCKESCLDLRADLWLLQGMKVLPLCHPAKKRDLLFVCPHLTCRQMLDREPEWALLLLSSVSAAERRGDGLLQGWPLLVQPSKPTRTAGILICHLAPLNLGLFNFSKSLLIND